MSRKKSFVLLFFSIALCQLPTAFCQLTYLHCGKLIDSKTDKVQSEMTIVVDGNKITKVEKGFSATPEGAKTIDLKSKTVLPGFMDMHVHLEGEMNKNKYVEKFTRNPADIAFASVRYADITLMTGFTSVRDLGGTGVNTSLRNAINSGKVIGPRVYSAGKSLAITGGHADPTNGYRADLMGNPGPKEGVVNGANDARKAVRQRYKNGADLIKITATGGVLSVAKDGTGPHFSEEEMSVICQTAKDLGMKVAAHAHGDEGMQRAIRAGVASIEHGTMMSEATMELMKKKGTWYVPTITAGKAVEDSAKIPGYFPPIVTPKALEVGPKIHATFSKAYKNGVKIAYGTDAGVYKHGKNMLEFLYMHEGGMPVMEIIKSATINAATLLGVENKLGTIESGKLADIIAVNEDPNQNPKTMLNVSFVMKDGIVYKNSKQ